jgi:hypothetical protein
LKLLLRAVRLRKAPAYARRHRRFVARRGRARTLGEGTPEAMVLRHGARPGRQQHAWMLQVLPRITLLLQRAAAVVAPPPRAASPMAAPGLRVARIVYATERSTHLLQRERERERVLHILHSTQLATVLRHQATRRETATRVEAAYPPVAERLLLRTQAASTPRHDPAPPTPQAMAPGALRHEMPHAGRPPTPTHADVLAPHELARVTDHVLSQLDTRVLSWRERHGQV